MVAAIANPHTDVLGHCTGRLLSRPRPARVGVRRARRSSRPAASTAWRSRSTRGRSDSIRPGGCSASPVEVGCLFSIDTDAHAPGQLEWQTNGCARAEQIGIDPTRVINTMSPADLLARR